MKKTKTNPSPFSKSTKVRAINDSYEQLNSKDITTNNAMALNGMEIPNDQPPNPMQEIEEQSLPKDLTVNKVVKAN